MILVEAGPSVACGEGRGLVSRARLAAGWRSRVILAPQRDLTTSRFEEFEDLTGDLLRARLFRARNIVLVAPSGLLPAFAACGGSTTLTGTVSDDSCRDAHIDDEHQPMTEHECALACVRNRSRLVLVTTGRVYSIENQDAPGLAEHAGEGSLRVKGRLAGDRLLVTGLEPLPHRSNP